jgi:hypothetical protein
MKLIQRKNKMQEINYEELNKAIESHKNDNVTYGQNNDYFLVKDLEEFKQLAKKYYVEGYDKVKLNDSFHIKLMIGYSFENKDSDLKIIRITTEDLRKCYPENKDEKDILQKALSSESGRMVLAKALYSWNDKKVGE